MSILRTTIVSIITQVALTLSFQVVASDSDEEAAARGKLVFETCANCHTIDQGGEHLLGPNLHGIYGRKIAAANDFSYSDTLSKMDGVWNADKLNRYIARPKLAAPGNQMPYRGLTSPHMRADLIAWLKTNPGEYEPQDTAIETLINDTDIEKGQSLATACLACHAAGKDMPHRIGPNL